MVNRKAESQSTILSKALLKVETNTLSSNHSAPDLSKGVNQYRLTNHFLTALETTTNQIYSFYLFAIFR